MKKLLFLLAVLMTLSLTTNLFAADPVMVKDINPNGSSNARVIKVFGDYIIFEADDGTHGIEKWMSDGTESGTWLLKDINPNGNGGASFPDGGGYDGVVFNNEYYFNGNNGEDGYELWKTDGTEAGTIMVKDIYRGSNGSVPYLIHGITYNNQLIFAAHKGRDYDQEPFKTDGTEAGTVLIKDLVTRAWTIGSMRFKGSIPGGFANLGDYFYFHAHSTENDNHEVLIRSDGTESGTTALLDNNQNPIRTGSILKNFNNIIYFASFDESSNSHLWRTDGTSQGTYMVKSMGNNGSNAATLFTECGDKIFFSAFYEAQGYELWTTEGTEATTQRVKEINPTTEPSIKNHWYHKAVLNDIFYFQGNDGTNGYELWRSDGTESGTYMVKDINTNGDGIPRLFVVMDGKLYFVANDGNSVELWETDGTESGTIKISNINPNGDAAVGSLIALNDVLYFRADDGINGMELWKYDPNAVDDTTPPVAVCQNLTIELDASGGAGITASQIDNGSSDDLGIASMTLDKYDFICADVGANTVTLTVTDYGGNTNNCTATVTVQDNTAPDAQCQNVTVSLVDGSASVSADDVDNGSSDACGIASISLDQTTFTSAGDYNVTLNVTDNNSNSSTCGAVVTVTEGDTEPPTISVSVSPTALTPVNQQMRTVTASVSASDNLPGVSYELTSITSNQADAGLFKKDKANDIQNATYNTADTEFSLRAENYLAARVYTITYTATDAADNTATASAYVTVPYSGKLAELDGSSSGITNLTLFPNPANDELTLQMEMEQESSVVVRLFDILGVERYYVNIPETRFLNQSIDMKGLLPGIYLVEIRTNGRTIHKKIIKK